jgi:hypothetical protein
VIQPARLRDEIAKDIAKAGKSFGAKPPAAAKRVAARARRAGR